VVVASAREGMEFMIEELRVFWPYPYVYPEQFAYQVHLKHLLDKTGVSNTGLLEMPCGTGKTMSVMALVVSYQLAYPAFGKLFFLSRTVPEMEAALGELKRLHAHLLRATAAPGRAALHERVREFLGVGLSARAQLCVNEEVNGRGGGERADVDGGCRSLQPEWGGEGCRFRMSEERPAPSGVATLEELRADVRVVRLVCCILLMLSQAAVRGYCGYYAARDLLGRAKAVVCSYQYVLHGKILEEILRPHIVPRSLAVFDEAHNMDQVCVESLTVRLGRPTLEDAGALCEQLVRVIISRVLRFPHSRRRRSELRRSTRDCRRGYGPSMRRWWRDCEPEEPTTRA
jgi:DNA excision repair protein ERCC-2